eukprot:TRINITY_DN3439_c5_g1_i1.p2 TRINITY_DN3439_c5_g1~~TRINITY_DN3439_c5_g1_i1.p2  ORF type:complete len:165 (+),score=18.00 TRINITY_DN3439_c5_g1_i1:582-1076(+)
MVQRLLKHTQCNPNFPIIFHDIEPAREVPVPSRKVFSKVKKDRFKTPLYMLPPVPYYSLSVTPLYHAILTGQQEIVEALLTSPRIDVSEGCASSDPRSRISTKTCADVDPSLAGHASLKVVDQAFEKNSFRGYDWVAHKRLGSRSGDAHRRQEFSVGLGGQADW